MDTSKFSPFNKNSDDLKGSGIGNGAYPPPPPPPPLRVRSFLGLIAGVLSAAAFVAAPSAASAQLQLTVLAFETERIELSISGTLSGDTPTASGSETSLYIQATPGVNWIPGANRRLSLTGAQPLSGVALGSSSFPQATADSSQLDAFGDFIRLPFPQALISGTTQGSGESFTLAFSAPIFDPSAIAITDLNLRWGFDTGQTTQPFGTFQSNAVVPEPSAYAALIGLAALGCVALRRRVR